MIHIDLIYISVISILAPTALGAALFKILPRELRAIAILVFATCLLEAVSYVASLLYFNNLFLFHAFTYVEFGCISFMYFSLFRRIRKVRRSILFLGVIFLGLSIYFLLIKEGFDQYNSLQRAVENSIVVVYALFFLFLFSKRTPEERFLLKPYFFLSCGFLIYFSVTFVVFLDANHYIELNNLFNWSVHSVMNILLNAIYFSALWTGGRMMRKTNG